MVPSASQTSTASPAKPRKSLTPHWSLAESLMLYLIVCATGSRVGCLHRWKQHAALQGTAIAVAFQCLSFFCWFVSRIEWTLCPCVCRRLCLPGRHVLHTRPICMVSSLPCAFVLSQYSLSTSEHHKQHVMILEYIDTLNSLLCHEVCSLSSDQI